MSLWAAFVSLLVFSACKTCVSTPESPELDGEVTGWKALCSEVSSLRLESPHFIAKLGRLYEARQIVASSRRLQLRKDSSDAERPLWDAEGNGACTSNGGEGPWRLKVDLHAPDKAPTAYRKNHRILLIFSKDWPRTLPTIRFIGKIRSAYAVESSGRDDRQDLHTSEANGRLLKHLQAAAGRNVSCMWRQTGQCMADGGIREPDRDQLCSEQIPLGASGYCDCDGNDEKGIDEPGFDCERSPGSCEAVCPKKQQTSGVLHSLQTLLQHLHRSFAGPLHPSEQQVWQQAAQEFAKEVSTVTRYESYGRRHAHLYRSGGLSIEDAIDPRLLSLLNESFNSSREVAYERLMKSGLISEIVPGLVFSFPVFRIEFCELLMEEIRHFYASKLPARRPNSMNNYGVILNEIGLEPLVFDIQDAVIQPLASVLLPVEGSELESHHTFTIRYKGGEDTHLDVHTDDSDVTFNVNIFGNYSGAPLVFCGLNGFPDHRHFRTAYMHELGQAVLHRGRHRHGAEDITGGERMNLVVWSYSHNYRSSKDSEKKHQKEAGPPDPRCVSYTHDRDFGKFRSWPEGKKERFLGRGWCPPRGKEYNGFEPDVSDAEARRLSQQAHGGGGGGGQ